MIAVKGDSINKPTGPEDSSKNDSMVCMKKPQGKTSQRDCHNSTPIL
jgi:hypothetical protein